MFSCVFSPVVALALPRQRTAGPSSPPQGGPAPKPPWKKMAMSSLTSSCTIFLCGSISLHIIITVHRQRQNWNFKMSNVEKNDQIFQGHFSFCYNVCQCLLFRLFPIVFKKKCNSVCVRNDNCEITLLLCSYMIVVWKTSRGTFSNYESHSPDCSLWAILLMEKVFYGADTSFHFFQFLDKLISKLKMDSHYGTNWGHSLISDMRHYHF